VGAEPGGETDLVHRPVFVTSYDNLGEPTQRQHYDGDGASVGVDANGNVILTNASGFTQTRRSACGPRRPGCMMSREGLPGPAVRLGPTDGTLANSALLTNHYYNHGRADGGRGAGRTVEQDQLRRRRRPTFGYSTDGAGGVSWSAAASVSSDTVLEQSQQLYDGAGNVVATSTASASTTPPGPGRWATDHQPDGSGIVQRRLLRLADRLTASVNVGTNQGASWTGRAAYRHARTPCW